MTSKLSITMTVSVLIALEAANLDVDKVQNAVDSALGELSADSPVVKVEKARATKETQKKPSLFRVSQTEKTSFEGALTAPLRFYLWNEAIGQAEAAAEGSFPVELPENGRIATWLAKFAEKPKEKAA